MKLFKSGIPVDAIEEFVSPGKLEGMHLTFRTMNCVLDGELVGQRQYSQDGTLVCETPLQNGQKHGREYTWSEDGTLLLVEPYFEGKIHGVAKQYGPGGRLIGTYKFVHGTGFDIWRQQASDGRIYISEIHSMEDGLLHGYEWWFNSEASSVWHERHWRAGRFHGIERMWNTAGKLRRGYPKYWIMGQAVTRRRYVRAAEKDKALPIFEREDNSPNRKFPPDIERLLPSR